MRFMPTGPQGVQSGLGLRRRSASGFTLIELLVVVAIIALLIAILLPSLAQARKQSRTALCGSRMSQLTKCIILYAQDYDETPPFLGTGYENLTQLNDSSIVYWGKPVKFWAEQEKWAIPNWPDYCLKPETQWPADMTLRNGSLFQYARFESLYRCPEFERAGIGQKSQGQFNYTRAITCRKFLSKYWKSDGTTLPIAPGPIMKPSALAAPAQMYMLMDEQWDYHVATPADQLDGTGGDGFPAGAIWRFWMGIDPIQCICNDMMGSYHGMRGKDLNFEAIRASEYGSISFYDGHVEVIRDPLPYRELNAGSPDFYMAIEPGASRLFGILSQLVFAQRGQFIPLDELIRLFLPIGF